MTGPFEPPSPSHWPSDDGVDDLRGAAPQGPPSGPPPNPFADSTSIFSAAPTAPAHASSHESVSKGGGDGRWVIPVLLLLMLLIALVVVIEMRPGSSSVSDDDVASADVEPDESTLGEGSPDADADADADAGGGSGGGGSGGGDEADGRPGLSGAPFLPDSVAVDGSSVWASDIACGVVAEIDAVTGEVVGVVDVGGSASGVAIADGSVWVGTREQRMVVRLDPETYAVQDLVPVEGYALGLRATDDEVWVTDPVSAVVYRVDAVSGDLLETIAVGERAHHIAIGDGVVWVTNNDDGSVSRIEIGGAAGLPSAAPSVAERLAVGAGPLHVELGEGSAWVTNSLDGTVHRLAEDTGEVEAVIDVGAFPHALAVAAGSVWVGTEDNTFWRIDPLTNTAEQVDGVEFDSISTAVDGTDIWVADSRQSAVIRFDAAASEVALRVDLAEFGDCEAFRSAAVVPPLVDAV